MVIKFYRGDDHSVKFRFLNFNGTIDEIYFTIKNQKKETILHKRLKDGIDIVDDYYVINFVPNDTDNIDIYLEMEYDIQIVVDNKKYTIAKNKFILDEDITTPENEV